MNRKCIISLGVGIPTLVFIISLVITVGGFKNARKEAKSEKACLEKERRAAAQRISELCLQYNAVSNWTEVFEGVWSPFTIELENALIRSDGRPVLFLGEIKDVTKSAEGYSVLFEFYHSVSLHFILDCAPEQVTKIMNHRESISSLTEFVVITKVTDVKKVSNLYSVYDEVMLNFNSKHFVARGTCLDLLFLGDSGLSFWELNDLLSNK